VAEYQRLVAAGADGVTLYQETYDPRAYDQLHNDGPKAGFSQRLAALDRAGEAGMRRLSLGALWGLAPWRREALSLAIHAAHLQKKWWRSQVLIGLPRLHNVPDTFQIPCPLDDRSLVHIIVALRLFLEDAGIVLSTRESAELRQNLLPLGITQMSAGSKTAPGGYGTSEESGEQFSISDNRDPESVGDALLRAGFEPVWKDWDTGFRIQEGTHD
jgi:2-iminoacetate synthase